MTSDNDKDDKSSERLQAIERSLLTGVFKDSRTYEEAGLSEAHFYDPRHGRVWKCFGILRSRQQEIDVLTLGNMLDGELSGVGGIDFLTELKQGNVNHKALPGYVKHVRDCWVKRQVARIAKEATATSLSGEESLRKLQNEISRIDCQGGNSYDTTLKAAITRFMDTVRSGNAPKRLPDGMELAKHVPGGLPRGLVTSIFADSGSFKSTVKNQLVIAAAKEGHMVLDASFEDPEGVTVARHLSQPSQLPYGRIFAWEVGPGEVPTLNAAERSLERYNTCMHTSYQLLPTMDEVIRRARQIKADLVCVDYTQLLQGRGKEKEVIDDAMRKAEWEAKRSNAAYVMVHQRSRIDYDRDDPRPSLHEHMYGSSYIKQCSKLLLGIWRPQNYSEYPGNESEKFWKPYAKLYETLGPATYEEIVLIRVLKNMLGRGQADFHIRCDGPTGKITPFDMRPFQ